MATVPPAPSLSVTSRGALGTSITVNSDSNGNGGSTVTQWQLVYSRYSTMGSDPDYIFLNDVGVGTVTGLLRGTTYYLWARRRNAVGWGPWSTRVMTKTYGYPAAPSKPVLSSIKTGGVTVKFTQNSNGGTAVIDRQVGWGFVSGTISFSALVPTSNTINLVGLTGGRTIFFAVRVRNSVGWGPWSPVASAFIPSGFTVTSVTTTTVGTHTTTRTFIRPAVGWMKVDGVWRVIIPYRKSGGIWKETK